MGRCGHQTAFRNTLAASLSVIAMTGCHAVGGDTDDRSEAGTKADDTTSPGGEPLSGLRFTSDRSFIFEERGERARLEVEVYRDGRLVPRAEVRFQSSDPSVISVDQNGVVVAEADLGSALITVEADGVAPATANAVIADLAPNVRRLRSSQILEVDRDIATATLHVSEETLPFAAGDILLSGEREGLFVRVNDVWRRDDGVYVIAYDTNVALTEAFENLDLHAVSDPVTLDPELHAAVLDRLTCTGDVDGSIEFIRPEILPIFETRLAIDTEIRWGIIRSVSIYGVGTIGAEGHTGEVKLEGRFGGDFRCHVALPELVAPPVPVLGPALSIGGKIRSRIGMKGGAFFEDASLAYAGPTFAQELEGRLGVKVRLNGDVEPIREIELVRSDITHGEPSAEFHDAELQLDIGPFVEADLVVSPRFVGGLFGIDLDLLTVMAGGGLDLAIRAPLDPYAAGYTGPRWDLFVEGSADLLPLLAGAGAFVEFANRRLGMSLDDEAITSLPPLLWELHRVVAGSPRLEVVTDREHIALGEQVEIAAQGLGRYRGNVEYLIHRCSEGQGDVIADIAADKSAYFVARGDDDRGEHGLSALLWDGLLGHVGLPYAPANAAPLRVGDNPGQICAR
jgi:hypothetical protein